MSPISFRVHLRAAALWSMLILSGCGGGGGGSSSSPPSGNTGTPTPPAPVVSMSVVPNSVQQISMTTDAAQMANLNLTVANRPDVTLYLADTFSRHGLANVSLTGVDATHINVGLQFQSPAVLGVGTYSDRIYLYVCYDTQCKKQIENSPYPVDVTYTVTYGSNPSGGAVVGSLSPSTVTAGGAAFPLTITGSGFSAGDAVLLNGSQLVTASLISSTQLIATIPASAIASSGSVSVVVEQLPGETLSNSATLSVAPAGTLSLVSISPRQVTTGGPTFNLVAEGSGFSTASIVQVNGAARTTTYVSPTELLGSINASDIASAGSLAVTVFNPGVTGGVSGALDLSVAPQSLDAVAYQINPAHTGATSFNNYSAPATTAWSITLAAPVSYPLIADGRVFVTYGTYSENFSLLALDASTGNLIWGPITVPSIAQVSYDNGTVFVAGTQIGSADLPTQVQAFDAATGTLKWTTPITTEEEINSPPTAANGLVYVVGDGGGGILYALDENTGAIVWSQFVDGGDQSAPAVSADGVYVDYPCQVYGFRPSTGEIIWHNSSGCDGGGGATTPVANGLLFAANTFGTGINSILNAETGVAVGTFPSTDLTPAVTSQYAFYIANGNLICVSLTDATTKWTFTSDGSIAGAPIVINGTVFAESSATGKLYGIDIASGAVVWTQNALAPNGSFAAMNAGDGLLLVPNGASLSAYVFSTSP